MSVLYNLALTELSRKKNDPDYEPSNELIDGVVKDSAIIAQAGRELKKEGITINTLKSTTSKGNVAIWLTDEVGTDLVLFVSVELDNLFDRIYSDSVDEHCEELDAPVIKRPFWKLWG